MKLDRHSFLFTVVIAGMVALPPLSIDMILPAIPALGGALGVGSARAGLAISLFLMGFAFSQVVLGPWSDRLGRRPVLLASLALFTAGGAGCALAGSAAMLFSLRLVQGLGAGGCTVIIFAIVRDLFQGSEVRSKLASANAIMGLAPMIAPSIGAAMLAWFNWRGLFAVLAAGGLALLCATGLMVEESIGANRQRVGAGQLAAGYLRVLSIRQVAGCTIVSSLSFGLLQSFVIGSSFLFMEFLHITPRVYGVAFAAISSGIVLGGLGAGRCAARGLSYQNTLLAGILLGLTGSLVMLGLHLGGAITLRTAIPTLLCVTTALGLITPTAAHGVLEPLPQIAGTASAVLGFVRMAGGAVASAMVSLFTSGSPAAMIVMMLVCSCSSLLVWITMVRPPAAGREPEPA